METSTRCQMCGEEHPAAIRLLSREETAERRRHDIRGLITQTIRYIRRYPGDRSAKRALDYWLVHRREVSR